MHRITLDNGTRVILVPFSGTEAATVLVLVKVGSRYEYKAINGAAHFVEHLMFKGTKKRPNTLAITRALDAVGAEYNAFTNKETTGYYIKADGKHVPLAIDLLHDMLFHSRFVSKEVERERGVIIEEINMYHDNPMMYVEDLLEQAMFDGSTLGWEITGTHETMRAMSRRGVMDFHNAYYLPSRIVLVVSGKISSSVLSTIRKTFGSVRRDHQKPSEFQKFRNHVRGFKPRVNVHYKDTKQIQLALGFPGYGIDDKRNSAVTLLSTILGGSMSSRLFIAVRERRGLAYRVGSSASSYHEVGNFMIQAGLEKARLPLAMKTILAEVRRMTKKGVTARELREAKDHVRGKILLRFEDSSSRAEWHASQELLQQDPRSMEERLRELQRVTLADVRTVAREILDTRRMTMAAIGPYKTPKAFLKAAKL